MRAIGKSNMDAAKIKEAIQNNISLTTIGIFGSSLLIVMGFIGQWAFVCLIIVFLFRDSLEELTFSWKGFSMKRKAEKALLAKFTEPQDEELNVGHAELGGFKTEIKAIGISGEEIESVIKAIGGTKYTFRTVSGITKDSALPKDIVKDKINWLILHELADEFEISGKTMYALSQKGQNTFQSIVEKNS